MKSKISLSIDTEIWHKFQRTFPGEASNICENTLRLRLNQQFNDSGCVDLELLKLKQKELNDQMIILKENSIIIADNITLTEQKMKELEKERLEQKKMEIESLKTCSVCKLVIENPRFLREFKPGVWLCKSCLDPNNPKFMAFQKENK